MTYSNHLKSTALVLVFLTGSLAPGNSSAGIIIPETALQTSHFLIACEEIEVKLDITHTTENQSNGKIVMNFKKTNTSYTSFLLAGEEKNNRLNVKDNEISDLGKGEYNLYIQDKNGCTKHIKFKIN